MPKEVIVHPQSVDVSPPEGEVLVVTDPQLTLHWSSFKSTEDEYHGVVQLSIATFPTVAKAEWRDAKAWPPEPTADVYSSTLDREELNRLIRFLRRARDAVYGRDE